MQLRQRTNLRYSVAILAYFCARHKLLGHTIHGLAIQWWNETKTQRCNKLGKAVVAANANDYNACANTIRIRRTILAFQFLGIA